MARLSTSSIKARFGFTLVSNLARSGVSFLLGIALARGLGPAQYGSYVFLLSSFAAVRALLDLGTSTAFFTFISQRRRSRRFVLTYAAWQVLQFMLPLLVIALLFPDRLVGVLWVGENRTTVVLAFVANFFMLQAWQTISQIGEAERLTFRVHSLNLAVTLAHLVFVMLAWVTGVLSVRLVLAVMTIEYAAAIVAFLRVVGVPANGDAFDLRATISDYAAYCRPLILYSVLGFAYGYADNWLLQRFGGAVQRGFYGAAFQVVNLSMMMSGALVPIFWKEIAEAHELRNRTRVAMLYRRVTRLILVGGAAIGGALLPWSRELAVLMFGVRFGDSSAILAIMLLYPAYASLGQIIGTMFVATGNIRPQVLIGTAQMAVGIPLSYFVQAPRDAWVPGLALGGVGMALKTLIITVVATNVMAWWVARQHQWRFDWIYQNGLVVVTACIGCAAYALIWLVAKAVPMPVVFRLIAALTLDGLTIVLILWRSPGIVGVTRWDLEALGLMRLGFGRC